MAEKLNLSVRQQLGTHMNPLFGVHLKKARGCDADICAAGNEGSLELEMLLPHIGAWMEQPDYSARL
jgi:hypothetical protein